MIAFFKKRDPSFSPQNPLTLSFSPSPLSKPRKTFYWYPNVFPIAPACNPLQVLLLSKSGDNKIVKEKGKYKTRREQVTKKKKSRNIKG